jgi:hypothetical protein
MSKLKRLHYILFHSEGALTEFFLGLISLTWGAWVLCPFWDAFAASSSFRLMDEIAPEWAWGGAMTLGGLCKIYTILSEQTRAKKLVFLASVFMWSCVSISFIAISPHAVGAPIYSLITAANAFCVWRSGGKV